jgi:hypothetical protein
MNTCMKPFVAPRRSVALFGVLGLVAFAFRAGAIAAEESRGGWRTLPLIEGGKIHPDWAQVGWGGFLIDDGALKTECDPRGLGLLVYARERFGNCQLRIVFKARDAKSNSGVYVRMTDGILRQVGKSGPAFDRNAAGKISKESMDQAKLGAEREEGPWFAVHQGYEVQIADNGDAFHRTGAIYSLAPSTATPNPGAWRTIIVTLDGNRVSVDLDGKRVTDFDPDSPSVPSRKSWSEPKRELKRPQMGYIGLQNHDPGEVVWFKEVSVRPLPRS